MVREFKLPDVGEGVAEGELLVWHVEVGDRVEEDQVVAEVETDKAAVDVPSPVDGTVRELLAEPGETVPVGDVIITFDVSGEADAGDAGSDGAAGEQDATVDTETVAGADEATSDGRAFAPPSARRLARELDVDIGAVGGSGPGGRVTEADVRAAAESGEDTGESGDGLKSAVTRIDDGDGEDGGLGGVVSGAEGVDAAGNGEGTGVGADRDRTLAAPATRRVAAEFDVDIDAVPTDETREGEAYVTERAVREYAAAQRAAQAADAAAIADAEDAGAAAEVGGAVGEGESERGESGPARAGEEGARERREPYRGVRKTIGEAMERSKFTAPHVTHFDKVDATALVAARERLKTRAEERGVRLTYVPFVMKAVAAALAEHPVLNTALDEENDEVVYRNYYNLGVATATDAGLLVPVVEDVDGKGLLQLASETNEKVKRARDRSIAREEMQGGTFTVTNFGAIGGEYATPIINYPETAVLGLGAIEKRPMVVEREARSASDGANGDSTERRFADRSSGRSPREEAVSHEVQARDTLTLSLSIDHRVIDGADAARFVNTLKEYLRDPTLLLLE